jgi:ketosteroid isomerase-like protein
MSQENVQIARAAIAAVNAGNMDAARESLDPDVIIVSGLEGWPERAPIVGRDAVVRQWERTLETWDAASVEPISFIDVGDRVVVRQIGHAVGRGPDFNVEFTVVFTMRKGKCFLLEYFWDHAEALKALGLSKAQENVDIVRHSMDLWNSGDVEALVAAFTDDAELQPAPGFIEGGRLLGHEGLRHFFEQLHEAWKPGDSVTLGEIREAGDKVMFSFRWRAIGDVSGIETTSEWIAVDTFRDGLIARMQIFSDRAEALEAVGISE